MLERLGGLVGKNNKIGKAISDYSRYKQAHQVASHFSQYLHPGIATAAELKAQTYRIRHTVYCEELKLEAANNTRLETDEFDSYSLPCYIQHSATQTMAGTVRIVHPHSAQQLLPIEKYCVHAITDNALLPANFAREKVCEVSRLAIPEQFRRRSIDKFQGSQTGELNPYTFSQTELRCFPFIAVGLYLTAAALVIQKDIEHIYVMVEPRLAKNMRLIGIKFRQIGPVIDYHGQRAAHYIDLETLTTKLTGGFAVMLNDIIAELAQAEGN
ncbi:PEP-CTERM/exosortase system-associated acyltransferase [Alteromonas profundi]|nr:PEP-CTERM/exosortase system-associated acyltransferase [Alteromonas profundi]